MNMILEITLRLFVALLLGGVIGIEREYRSKEAGFRTHFLVALGSALFCVVSQYGFGFDLKDSSRVAAQVVSGIGFLGAGTIIFQKNVVRGLTTAAGLWVTAAIGLACGTGMYIAAAIATAISQVVSTLVYLFYIFGKKSVFDFKIKNYYLSKEVASEIFKIGIPTLVFQILTSLSISLINNAAADYGDAAIAGMGVVIRLVSMGSLTIFGFIKGFQPIAGYSYGAKKFNRLHEAIKTSIIWSTIFCVVYGLILALFSTSIVSQFASGNLEMIKVGASSLRVNGISLMLFGFYTVYSSLFLALGKGKEGFILGACRQGICFVPVILVLPMIWGLNGILYAQPVADVLSAIITVFMAIHLHRELNEAEKQAAIAGTNEVH